MNAPGTPEVPLKGGSLRHLGLYVAAAVFATLPALAARLLHLGLAPPLQALLAGMAILAAGFMLSWSAETAEEHASQGLVLAVLALVNVLPEYAVDVYYTFRAGREPASDYVHYAAANMTGSNRLLVGAAWPLTVLLHWWRSGRRSMDLDWSKAPEVAFLGLAGAYGFVIVARGSVHLLDTAVLLGLYGLYLWRVGKVPKEEGESEEVGPAAALEGLPPRRQYAAMAGLALWAVLAILASVEPFAEGLVASGRRLGVDEFLLIQWLAPLASEAPNFVLVALFVLARRPQAALGSLISDKINQWTLLVGILPAVYSVGLGHAAALPLGARQDEEFFLTAAQSLFAVALLLRLRLRLGLASAAALLVPFLAQLAVGFAFQRDEARAVHALTIFAWGYVAAAAILLVVQARPLARVLRAGLDPGAVR